MGQLWVGGTQREGSLGLPIAADDIVSPLTQIPGDWVSVAHSRGTMAAVDADGKLYTCGSDIFGLCGQGTEEVVVYELTQVGSDVDWVKVWGGVLGTFHALKNDGTLWAWGNNGMQPYLGLGTIPTGPYEYHEPELMTGDFTGLVNVVTNSRVTWFLFEDGSLWACGENNFNGFLNTDETLDYNVATDISANVKREGDDEVVTIAQISALSPSSESMMVRGEANAEGQGMYFANGYSDTVGGRLGWNYGGPGFMPDWFPVQGSWGRMPYIMNGDLWAIDDTNGNSDYPNDYHVGTGSSESDWVKCSGNPSFSSDGYVILDKNDGGLYGTQLLDVAFPTDYTFDELVPPATFDGEVEILLNPDTNNWGDDETFVVLIAAATPPVEPGEFWTAFVLTEEIE